MGQRGQPHSVFTGFSMRVKQRVRYPGGECQMPDSLEASDELWLRERTIALLQSYIAPCVVADSHHIEDMARARRVLRQMGVRPVTEVTLLERIAHKVLRDSKAMMYSDSVKAPGSVKIVAAADAGHENSSAELA